MKILLAILLFLSLSCSHLAAREYFHKKESILVYNGTGFEMDLFYYQELKAHIMPEEEVKIPIQYVYGEKYCLTVRIKSRDSLSYIQKCASKENGKLSIIFDKEDLKDRYCTPLQIN